MNIDTAFQRGDRKKPVLVFIHGLGMDKKIWENPSESRVLAGNLPIQQLLSGQPPKKDFGFRKSKPEISGSAFTAGLSPDNLETAFTDLKSKGYPVVTWSQKRPVGPVDAAVAELKDIVDFVDTWNCNGMVLVGHSRGGLIARKYLMHTKRQIRGLITVSTPHRGSSLARLAVHISPLSSLIAPLFSESGENGLFRIGVRRIIDFLESRAVRELLPDSDFFRSLRDTEREGTCYMSIGGTSPSLFRLFRWKWETERQGPETRWIRTADPFFSIPENFEKVIPYKLFPDELKRGLGDGLVTAASSRMQWGGNHVDFSLNHVEVLFDKNVRKVIVNAIAGLH